MSLYFSGWDIHTAELICCPLFKKLQFCFHHELGKKKKVFLTLQLSFLTCLMLELVCCFKVVHQSANDANSVSPQSRMAFSLLLYLIS